MTDHAGASGGSLFGKMKMDHAQDPPATKLKSGLTLAVQWAGFTLHAARLFSLPRDFNIAH